MNKSKKDVVRNELRNRRYIANVDIPAFVVSELIKILKNASAYRHALLYTAVEKWGEIDLSSLPDLLPEVKFETVEAVKDTPFPQKKFDAIVIPVFGFNKGGYRVGHGGGWYDKFLATQPGAFKIGISHENSQVDFASEPHDIPMDIIITEQRLRVIKSNRITVGT